MADWANLANAISQKSDVPLHPAVPELLSAAQKLGVPDDALSFFRAYEPAQCAEIESVRLWPLQEVLAENKDYVPGCYVIEHGYIVFATTVFGDAFCFDTNTPTPQQGISIVLISHDGYDWDTITAEEIAKFKKLTAPDFGAFLHAYVAGGIDIQPNYGRPLP